MDSPDSRIASHARLALAGLALIACVYIASAAYLGINGNHAWRQATTYGHILGFTEAKDFTALDLFRPFSPGDLGVVDRFVHDMPLYQYLIAKTALLNDADPLAVARYFNLAFWLLAAFAGYRLCCGLAGRHGVVAGVAFVYLLATSPLILHYYSAPMPDTLVLALALCGMALLHKAGSGWRGIFRAAPLLLAGAFIKSPVVFPFAIFYAAYAAVMTERSGWRDSLRQCLPVITLLLALLACAVLAEQLRLILVGLEGSGFFAQGGGRRIFGAWDLRASAEFWSIMWQRIHLWGPLQFGYLYLAVVAAALALGPDRKTLAVTTASLAAFFGGWLTLSRGYVQHDYYQLPLAAIFFVSFALSLSRILAWVSAWARERLIARVREVTPAALLTLAPVLALAQVALQPSLGERERARLWSGIEYALRDESRFLYVREPTSRNQPPTPGGLASTKFVPIDFNDFEANCEDYLARYAAVVSSAASPCLTAHRLQADYFIEDDGLIFYLNRGLRRAQALGQAQPLETDLLQGAAEGREQWTISGPGTFEYQVETIDGSLALTVQALEDMPWLAVLFYARDMEVRRYHEMEVEVSGSDGLLLHLGSWDFESRAPPTHRSRPIRLRDGSKARQWLILDFGAERERDYADVAARNIKAGQMFRIHGLRLRSSALERVF